MALRIACDLDGTLADMERALQEEAERLFGPHVDLRGPRLGVAVASSPGQPHSTPDVTDGAPALQNDPPAVRRGLTSAEMRRVWTQVQRTENFWAGLTEIEPGAVARLAALAARHGWEVLFITQRPATVGETAQRQSQRWLHAHGFEHPAVYVVNRSRGRVAESLGLDALVDDHPDHCIDVKTESQARPLLVWRDRPETVPAVAKQLGIDVVFSAAAAFEELDAMTRRARRPRGLLARVRDAMGAS